MLGLAKMTAGSWRYFDAEIAQGRENYYLSVGEEPGRWVGAGAHQLGLSGEVDAVGSERLFDGGRHPLTGEGLGRPFLHYSNRDTVTGFSLSFSPPKSVSVLWGLGDEHTTAEVRAAHDQAVQTAVSFLEQHACFARTGKAGVFQIETTGLVAAAFVHRTSRALDPQLHTHLLVANKVQGLDGQWRAVDGRELFTMQKPAGMVYNAALRAELSLRLGVEFEPVDRHGQADIVGVPGELVERFSARRAQVRAKGRERIGARERELGRELSDGERAEEYQRAALDHRPPKSPVGETDSELRRRWDAEALEAGEPAVSWLADAVHRVSVDRTTKAAVTVDSVVVDQAVRALTEEHSVFGWAEIAKHLAPLAPASVGDADAARQWVEQATAAVLAHPQMVTLACPLLADTPDGLRRGDGQATVERHGQRRWTTRLTLAREANVLGLARDGRGAGLAVVDPDRTALAIIAAGLSADQATAVGRLLRGGDQVACLVGPAGAGKTRAMRAAGQAWTSAGYRVFGVAVSARAAQVLEQEAGVGADTLARFVGQCDRGAIKLGPDDIVVVDEAGMVTTADLSRLAGLAADTDAKLVLVGDDHQLAPVGAGGLFRLLVEETGAAALSEVRRFSRPWERDASLRLRAGDRTVVDLYEHKGRVWGGTRDEMLGDALEAWKKAKDDGVSVVVLAADHATVDELAQRARAIRVAAGEVSAVGITAGGQTIGLGDEVVTTLNDRRLVTTTGHWVRNGDRWTVTNHSGGGLAVSSLSGHGHALLPGGYVTDNVRLGYALTIHKAQGVTVDRGILVGDDRLTAEQVYVAMTRGRHNNHAYLSLDTVEHASRNREVTAAGVLAAAVARPGVEDSATVTLRRQLERGEDLAVLYPLWHQAADHVETHAGPDRAAEISRLRRQAEPFADLQTEVRSHRCELEAIRPELKAAHDRREELRPVVLAGHNRHFWQRPPKKILQAAQAEFNDLNRRCDALDGRHNHLEHQLRRAEYERDAAATANDNLQAAELAQAARDAWIGAHPAEIGWRDQLRDRIDERTAELGRTALEHRPQHLLKLLGEPGVDIDKRAWVWAAGTLEAYRERWQLQPNELGASHTTSPAQARHWRQVELTIPQPSIEYLEPPAPVHHGPSLSLGL